MCGAKKHLRMPNIPNVRANLIPKKKSTSGYAPIKKQELEAGATLGTSSPEL